MRTCFLCGKDGHIAKYCRNRPPPQLADWCTKLDFPSGKADKADNSPDKQQAPAWACSRCKTEHTNHDKLSCRKCTLRREPPASTSPAPAETDGAKESQMVINTPPEPSAAKFAEVLAILKANIVSRDNIGSIMPAGLSDGITGVSRRNFFAFLGEIGKPGPFDASKGNVARLWIFDDQPPGALAKSAAATPVYTLVNGQLPKEFNPGRLYATARLTAAAATSKPLLLTGVKAAWLDGKALELKAGAYAASIPAGNHTLTVEIDGNAPYFKAQCDDASFLGD